MKLHVLSDLHLDHWREPFVPTCEDEANTVLILAGDIIGWVPKLHTQALAFFSDVVARYKHVIYVAGNHEYYGSHWATASHHKDLILSALDILGLKSKIDIVEAFGIVWIDNQRFLCGTGWIPRPPDDVPDITDARAIKRYKPEAFLRHKAFCEGLEATLTDVDIVIAHHLPSNHSIAPQYVGSIYNAWFVAPELEKLILARQPLIYIHGHTHDCCKYPLGRTRVICNPRAYPGEYNTFNPSLVVEI